MSTPSRTPSGRRRGRSAESAPTTWSGRPRWRLTRHGAIALGPGKADLLEAIATRGSISSAALALGMSYRRAWVLVAAMNAAFRQPLVKTSSRRRAGAALTEDGREVLRLYRRIEAKSLAAARRDLTTLLGRLRDEA